MKYQNSNGQLDTAKKILKVDHAGEFGAINIYRSQILVSKLLRKDYVETLEQFLDDEKRHLEIFGKEIQRRGGPRCKSFWLCGLGGYAMGFVSALIGKKGVMACTWAVESIVTKHLVEQLAYLELIGDFHAYDAVNSILKDEEHHRDVGNAEGGSNVWFMPFRVVISLFTEAVIRFGMR
ncbi:MAG TPA: demethoxyubiquinone hydroxylase family protein [Burkholderiales bacterium]|nr:demethoxyubiquinone hydroxylase family protein [Burkholderiales bacterium]